MPPSTKKLGQILKEMKLVSEYDIQEALQAQKEKGGAIGKILMDSGLITERNLLHAMGQQSGMEVVDLDTATISSDLIEMVPVNIVETYRVETCRAAVADGVVVILAGGTGSPFFTTDTCASLRAVEMGAEILLKGTKVDGVYSNDPKEDPGAKLYERISFEEVLEQRLEVMDATAIAMCRENNLPIRVFNMMKPGNIKRVLLGEELGTLVYNLD